MANFCNIWSPIISGKTSASSQDMYTHRCWGFHVLESIQSWYSTLNMRCVYVLGYGHTHACICSSVDLTCLRFASVCLQFRFFFFSNFLLMANDVDELIWWEEVNHSWATLIFFSTNHVSYGFGELILPDFLLCAIYCL